LWVTLSRDNHTDAAQAIGKSGNEGLDEVVKEDRLGLDIIMSSQAMSGDRRSKNSLALCTAITPLKTYSSQLRIFREMRTITSPRSGARSS
jgi:hypothetical protein